MPYKNILVPIAPDHGANTGRALQTARALAGPDAKITALSVLETTPDSVARYFPEGQESNFKDEALTRLKADLGGPADIKADVVWGHEGRTIVEYAEEYDVDLIVMSSHRPGLMDYFMGGTAEHVVRHATCAVHVLR